MIDLINFQWESEAQKKGVYALKQYLHRFHPDVYLEDAVLLSICYFVQKDHEAKQWYSETMGSQISRLEDVIQKEYDNFREKQRAMMRRIEALENKVL